jgi:reactive intermediate/imine deaminase
MARRAVETADAPAPVGPYSQGVVAAGVLYCSGQVPIDPATGELVAGGAAAQARRCLESLDAVCREADATLADAARLTIYLTDLGDFADVNEAYAGFFSEPHPARSAIAVSALPKGALVKIDAIVPVPEQSA